jgi:hypothetical protein
MIDQKAWLLPCPFCGGEPEWLPRPGYPDGDHGWLKCIRCGIGTEMVRRDFGVSLWNRRAAPQWIDVSDLPRRKPVIVDLDRDAGDES